MRKNTLNPDETEAAPSADTGPDDTELFPIVGVGASAGGLEAFQLLLEGLPDDTGMGFVLVQHLDPEHESSLVQILGRATSLPVIEIEDDQPVQPNHVHIIPPGTGLEIVEGVLKLHRRPRTRQPHRPIDTFFESLARDRRERAIGVVLSGTATDGTLGLEAIKAEAGFTFAQDDSAKYESMPRSAVAAACVDRVAGPAEIAGELARIATHPYLTNDGKDSPLVLAGREAASATAHEDDQAPLPAGEHRSPGFGGELAREEARRERGDGGTSRESGYKNILLLLRNHSGVDFSLYRSTTIQRRIARRVVLNKQDTLDDYVRMLRGNAEELDALYSDVLISVTSFFRNPEAFEALQQEVLPRLLDRGSEEPVRVWVLGCSTGQEAYSIAMTFVEAMDRAPRMSKLQIFATDLNEKLLDKARAGLYSKNLAQDISPERLRRFFVEAEGGYRVSKMLREMVVFARQNLISDPPFSRIDLVSCRNLLIYLDPSLQKKALPTFHYALKPGGFLLLGASESVGGFGDLFEVVDKKYRIFSKKPAATPQVHFPLGGGQAAVPDMNPAPSEASPPRPQALHGELNAQREADRLAINQFAPPGVLIDEESQILQFRGATGPFLQPPSGKATFDVLKMAREGLMLPLRAAINEAKAEDKTARREHVHINSNGHTRTIRLQVIPLKHLRQRCFLVVFEVVKEEPSRESRPAIPEESGEASPAPGHADEEERLKPELQRVAELESELTETREYLQSLLEQKEASNEELQAANEEVQSGNEELQSINEELETSKEELESANEELTTVNEEMSNRNVELNRLNDDLVNLQTSIRMSILLLGPDLRIRRFTQQAARQFDLLATDLGRPIGHLRHDLVMDGDLGLRSGDGWADKTKSERQSQKAFQRELPLDLEGLATETLDGLRELEREVRDRDGRWYSLRVRPYLTVDNKVDGAVLVLVDIDALKRSEQEAARLAGIVESSQDAIISKNLNGLIQSWNAAAEQVFGYAAAEVVDRPISLLIPEDRAGEERENLERVRRGEFVHNYESVRQRKDGGRLDVSLTVSPLRNAAGHVVAASEIIRDDSERREMERALEMRRDELAAADRRKNKFLAMLSHELRNPLTPIFNALHVLELEGSEASERAESREIISRQVRHLARLVDDLLEVSRITTGRLRLQLKPIELTDFVGSLVVSFRPRCEEKDQDLAVALPSEPLRLKADPTRLGQIVENLLANACKYTAGGGHVRVVVEPGEGEAVIRVRDDGVGIDPELLPRVFDLFSQGEKSLARSEGGLGLGLSLVRQLVELHGGTVEAHANAPERGSEFVVRLPLAPEAETVASAEESDPEPEGPAAALRILVVDDNADAAKMTAMLLRASGHEIRMAHSGPAALDVAQEFHPEVVLLDIGLPEMDGYEVAREFRKTPQSQGVTLVALTGYGQDSDRQRAREAGFDQHLVKPVEYAELKKLLGSSD